MHPEQETSAVKRSRKTCLLFPGQGAQFVGMGKELCEEFEAARRTFGRASEVLGRDIADICFNGPEHMLKRTDICQPAILTTSIAALNAVRDACDDEFSPAVCAGLSLGEYSAHVAAGAIGLEEAVTLTAARGSYMQQACEINPGTMYSVMGLEAGEVENICRELREEGGSVWPANYNSPTQLVISGEESAAAEAARLCGEKGARRTIQLKVAGPFHTPLMAPAAERLRDKLADVDRRPGRPAVIPNVSATPDKTAEEIKDSLAAQVTRPVKWVQSIEWCREENISRFLEIGPGKVLTGLLRRIDRSLSCTPLLSPPDIRKICSG